MVEPAKIPQDRIHAHVYLVSMEITVKVTLIFARHSHAQTTQLVKTKMEPLNVNVFQVRLNS